MSYAADEYTAADDDAFGPFADLDAERCTDCTDPACDGFECNDPTDQPDQPDQPDQRDTRPDPAAVRAMFAGFGWSVTNP